MGDDAGEPLALWGARDGGRLVGIVSLNQKDGLPVVEWIAVENAHRGCGLGRRLRPQPKTRPAVEVSRCSTRRPAPGFFVRMGYEVVSGDEQERVLLLAGCEGCAQLGGTCRPDAVRKDLEPGLSPAAR